MTPFGKFLEDRLVNKAALARKIGIRKSRLSQLSLDEDVSLHADELYLISLAINVDPGEMIKIICKDVVLPDVQEPDIRED
jgi:DNA-binding Xre family transcriptional regulator